MPTKKKQEWKGYLNPSLEKFDKDAIKKADVEIAFLSDWLTEMVEWGARFSYSLKGKEESHCLTITFTRDGHRLAGYSLSAWGKEFLQCLTVIHYYWSSGKYGVELEGLSTGDDSDWW